MKHLLVLFTITLLFSCNMEVKTETKAETLDIPAELAKIEAMRKSFEQTVREKRYGDLGKFTTPDMISVGPGSADWIAYRKLREEHGNKFRYDSIIMKPKETVIVSDSIAYDFGVSSMYYTDENGTVHELKDTFLVILKRMKNGEWKLHRELASSLVE
ncbi:MAG: hypothetical protein ABGX00_06985 [Allomuricauda sp.]